MMEDFEEAQENRILNVGLGILAVFAIVFLVLVVSQRDQMFPCSQYANLDPPVPHKNKCALYEMQPNQGNIVLTLPDGSEYVINLLYRSRDGGSFQLLIQHPEFDHFFVYIFYEDNIADSLWVGDIIIQRQEGSWFLRYPPRWVLVDSI